ncbi:MAG TPA: response regulator [Kouleothrix sp.]|uniref:response regulator n=1 Tax=Kouleothrix sp. TaxID=2779161 RepID=UPI002D05B015|nr:response regulator [Kouleothrix sp.]HRC76237.1 response regulator [Kouleothrix sp.]
MIEQRPTSRLLVVEDSDEDFEAIVRSLNKVGPVPEISRCVDGDDALDHLNGRGAYAGAPVWKPPSLILLDLNLPATDGREVLAEIKHDTRLSTIPVVVLTTSANPKDIEACYRAGANSYMIKPVNMNELNRILHLLCEYWFTSVVLPRPAS